MKIVISSLILSLLLFDSLYGSEFFGKYSGQIRTEWLKDGRLMKILEDFQFEDPDGVTWVVSKGSVTDGASIPLIAWSFVGGPYSGKYRNASVVHDIACQQKKRTWQAVHKAFYYAMRVSGVDAIKSKIMYAAVYHFGPRWPIEKWISEEIKTRGSQPQRISKPVKVPPENKSMSSENFKKLVELLKESEKLGKPLSLEQINHYH